MGLPLACCLALAALGCVRPGERLPPGVIAVEETEQTSSFVRNFNPLLEAGSVRWPTRRAMYEPMLIHNPLLGQYVPWLAESYTLECRSQAPALSDSSGRVLVGRRPVFGERCGLHLRALASSCRPGRAGRMGASRRRVRPRCVHHRGHAHATPRPRPRTDWPAGHRARASVAAYPRSGRLRQREAGRDWPLHRRSTSLRPRSTKWAATRATGRLVCRRCGRCAFGPTPPTSRRFSPSCGASWTGPAPSFRPSSGSIGTAIPSTTTTGFRCSTRRCFSTPTPDGLPSTTFACARPSAWPSTAGRSPRLPCTGTPGPPTPQGSATPTLATATRRR